MNITEIIRKYSAGETILEETNAALAQAGSDLALDPDKHKISPEEVGRFGLLDTGTGSMDKVEVRDGKLVDCDCGEMSAYVTIGGKTYKVVGDTLVE